MVTFQYKVNPKQKRRDGTMNVKIIVTYKRKRKMLPTSIYCTSKDITRGGKLKNQSYIDSVERTISKYRKKVAGMGLELGDFTLEYVVKKLLESDSHDFFSFTEDFVGDSRASTMLGYKNAANAVERFIGCRSLSFKEMTRDFFVRFENWLSERHGGITSGDILYINKVRAIYRKAQVQFNDENNEVISSYPLIAYKVPKLPLIEKRALPIETIRKIMGLDIANHSTLVCRDLFILSFCLMGMNAADIFSAGYTSETKICYNRAKTRGRRSDGAYMEVWIDPRVQPLVKRYRGKNKMFLFTEKFSKQRLRNILEVHIRKVGNMVGVEKLTFYAARHSFATIAYNDCGIDKYIVHSMLNHVPQEMKITDVYIKRTFEKENEANKKVLDLLFQQGGKCC